MTLTTVKPSNRQFREMTQRYIHEKPYKINISGLAFGLVGRISLIEIGKYFEQEPYKRNVAWYYWNIAPIHKSSPAFFTERIAIDRRLEELDKTGIDIHISYINQDAIEALLGEVGKEVLKKTLGLIKNTASKFKWPLHKIELQYTSDIEVENWNYVLLVLSFESDFDTADEYLNLLDGELDRLATTMTDEEQDILQRLLYFDVETTTIVSSS
jgi:hypothetical protein